MGMRTVSTVHAVPLDIPERECDPFHVTKSQPWHTQALVCCSAECAIEVIVRVDDDRPLHSFEQWPEPRLRICQHCAWCGRRVHAPRSCILHDDRDCPLHTWAGTVVMRDTLVELAARLGDVSDTAVRVAHARLDAYPEMLEEGGVYVADVVIERLRQQGLL
jgi:hypothetical protein